MYRWPPRSSTRSCCKMRLVANTPMQRSRRVLQIQSPQVSHDCPINLISSHLISFSCPMSRGRAADESVGVGVDTQSRPPSIATTRPSSLHPPIAATRPSTMAHQNERRGWELDESAFRSELQLIDDSYYRVYDDESYDVWRERIMSLVVTARVSCTPPPLFVSCRNCK